MSFDATPPPQTSPPDPAWPAPQVPEVPRRIDGVSLAAFITALTCCAGPLAIGLGIAGLVRTRGGRRSGRWAAISGLVIGVICTLLIVGVVGVGIKSFTDDIEPADARPGQCIDIDWADWPNEVSCDVRHEGEIVWAAIMDQSLMEEWDEAEHVEDFCLDRDLDERYQEAFERPDIVFDYWSSDWSNEPEEGEWMFCYITADNRDLDQSIADLLAEGSAV